MSKYDALWSFMSQRDGDELCLSFAKIEQVAGGRWTIFFAV